ncbi:MAG: phosphate ABC transporter ATP-binding protein [Gammaproteobacteria bacterium]|nr:phosphate ABC transporter ATP-binding protein [Gammaproteobacteria bacterium]MDJ0893368.1 phosphate ABC transporter ATP-binding protein [Gammaproteobacteria bacterium]
MTTNLSPATMAPYATVAPYAIETHGLNLWYGTFQALNNINLKVKAGMITSLIGPSGCGKTTFLRSVNRINERLGYVRTEGRIDVIGNNVYGEDVEIVELRKRVGMVFQRPNPLPVSIRENILYGYKLHMRGRKHRRRDVEDEIVENSLRQVLLWDAVKDRLGQKATELSLEGQQKLCIARLLPVKPDVLLMDEPCSALDPKGTEAVEELIRELSGKYTILIVTHNMAQARRASDECIFMLLGKVIEHGVTPELFLRPAQRETADYIEGRYG